MPCYRLPSSSSSRRTLRSCRSSCCQRTSRCTGRRAQRERNRELVSKGKCVIEPHDSHRWAPVCQLADANISWMEAQCLPSSAPASAPMPAAPALVAAHPEAELQSPAPDAAAPLRPPAPRRQRQPPARCHQAPGPASFCSTPTTAVSGALAPGWAHHQRRSSCKPASRHTAPSPAELWTLLPPVGGRRYRGCDQAASLGGRGGEVVSAPAADSAGHIRLCTPGLS